MLRIFLLTILLCVTGNSYAQQLSKQFPKSISVEVSNPLNSPRESVFIHLTTEQLKAQKQDFNVNNFVVVYKGQEIPSQYNVNDKQFNGVVFVLDKLGALENVKIDIRYNPTGRTTRSYPKRTQAELSHKVDGQFINREYVGGQFVNVNYLRVPPEHKDHSWFIRYEGPGWESDKVGYRFYLDQRNATDVFGKKTSKMILSQVGLDGFDSYHEMQPWGMDVMKVGKSLGLGSIGSFVGDTAAIRVEKTDSVICSIPENGSVFSSIQTNYYGWKIGAKRHDLESKITIHAGTLLTHQTLDITAAPENICTGIVKDKDAEYIYREGDAQHWAYLATYGKQSLNKDELGLVLFVNPDNIVKIASDKYSHIAVLKPNNGKIEYYFGAAWVGQPDGIKTKDQFTQYLSKTAEELAVPVKVSLGK
ncbi:DUF4861 domain-containing protein [Chryseosolibacter indicus]|uniref:DUF4861 family protein n=1 Tax=Chryseosolibacter indicus TaxID=2782351 RepID=A0ABS5VRF3_9BACT|nr:DUF4861 domain-containing protein [Chryseosolibacter indicus]MBT1704025.1 DUF4861 family protein [Chryseosolibacter indicus]